MLSGSLTGMLVALTCSVLTVCKGETLSGADQPLSASLWMFWRSTHAPVTAATSVSADMLSVGQISLPAEENCKTDNMCPPPVLWWFPGRASSSPLSCPGCWSRMQRASPQPQPIRAQRHTTRCDAVLLPNTIKPRLIERRHSIQ